MSPLRRSLTVNQRKRYIKSVQCLLNKEPTTKKTFPVVANRYEDFVALHANASAGGRDLTKGFSMMPGMPGRPGGMEDGVHFTGTFLPWHRYVIWVYESTLRDECGWDMGQPCMALHLSKEMTDMRLETGTGTSIRKKLEAIF
jgi:tyrosinase